MTAPPEPRAAAPRHLTGRAEARAAGRRARLRPDGRRQRAPHLT